MRKLRVSCIQMDAGADPAANKRTALKLFAEAVRRGSKLIAFPENFYWRGKSADLGKVAAQTPGLIKEFGSLAVRNKTSVLLGSVLEKSGSKKFGNVSVFISPSGKITRYRKIHLFDVNIKGARVSESRHIEAGKKPVWADGNGVRMGLSVCYDLRFPELYRFLSAKGCKVLFVPANFTETTGKAHWEILLRARAIENLAFVAAPGQTGKNTESGIRSFGNSLIIDPWGRVLARGSFGKTEVITADFDFKNQARIRRHFPVLGHRKL